MLSDLLWALASVCTGQEVHPKCQAPAAAGQLSAKKAETNPRVIMGVCVCPDLCGHVYTHIAQSKNRCVLHACIKMFKT